MADKKAPKENKAAAPAKDKAPRRKTPKTIAMQIGRKVLELNTLLGEAKAVGMSVDIYPNDPSGKCMDGFAITGMTVNDDLMNGLDASVKGEPRAVQHVGGVSIMEAAGGNMDCNVKPGENRFLKTAGLSDGGKPAVEPSPSAAASAAAAAAAGQPKQHAADNMDFRSTADKAAGDNNVGLNQQWEVSPPNAHTPGQGSFDFGSAEDEGNVPA